jgi:hypothetical protein
LERHISLYFLEWRNGLVAVAVIIPVEKAFAILKGRNHNGTCWRHLDKSWCEASEQSTDSMVTIDFTKCLEHGAALPRWFCNIIDMNAMCVLSVAIVPDNIQPRNFTILEIKGQKIKFWDLDL